MDGHDGFFYGVYVQRLIKLKKDGTGYTVIRKFSGPPLDGSGADHAPILGSDGRLYGLASGGQAGSGVVYSLRRDGTDYKVILNPESERLDARALVEGPDGKLYALVAKGIARFNKDGSDYAVIYATDGGNFVDAPFVKGDAICGVRYSGGAKGSGVVYRYGISGAAAAPAPAISIKEVMAAPLPAPERELSEFIPAPTSSTTAVETHGSAPSNAADAQAMPASPPGNVAPSAPAVASTAAPPQPASQPATAQPGSGPAGAAQTTLQKAEAQADAALAKAKEKAGQAANKAKSFFDYLTKKKK